VQADESGKGSNPPGHSPGGSQEDSGGAGPGRAQLCVPVAGGRDFRGGYGYRYTVVSTFPDGSIPVRRSDGALESLRPSDSVKLVSESPMREFLA
jgi:hypothetical protein